VKGGALLESSNADQLLFVTVLRPPLPDGACPVPELLVLDRVSGDDGYHCFPLLGDADMWVPHGGYTVPPAPPPSRFTCVSRGCTVVASLSDEASALALYGLSCALSSYDAQATLQRQLGLRQQGLAPVGSRLAFDYDVLPPAVWAVSCSAIDDLILSAQLGQSPPQLPVSVETFDVLGLGGGFASPNIGEAREEAMRESAATSIQPWVKRLLRRRRSHNLTCMHARCRRARAGRA